jgi:predicted transcriptional regulator
MNKLCIRWVNRGYLPRYNVEEFLQELQNGENPLFVTKRQLYTAMHETEQKRLIMKVGSRYQLTEVGRRYLPTLPK